MSGKLLRRFPPDALRGRIRCDELRILRLELFQFAHELIELIVGNGWLVENVITVFVFSNLFSELGDAVTGGLFHCFNIRSRMARNSVPGFHSGHMQRPAITRALEPSLIA